MLRIVAMFFGTSQSIEKTAIIYNIMYPGHVSTANPALIVEIQKGKGRKANNYRSECVGVTWEMRELAPKHLGDLVQASSDLSASVIGTGLHLAAKLVELGFGLRPELVELGFGLIPKGLDLVSSLDRRGLHLVVAASDSLVDLVAHRGVHIGYRRSALGANRAVGAKEVAACGHGHTKALQHALAVWAHLAAIDVGLRVGFGRSNLRLVVRRGAQAATRRAQLGGSHTLRDTRDQAVQVRLAVVAGGCEHCRAIEAVLCHHSSRVVFAGSGIGVSILRTIVGAASRRGARFVTTLASRRA